MSVYLNSGMVLLDSGSVATDAGCCCGETRPCCLPDGTCESLTDAECLASEGTSWGTSTDFCTDFDQPCCPRVTIHEHVVCTGCGGVDRVVDHVIPPGDVEGYFCCLAEANGFSGLSVTDNGDGTAHVNLSRTFIEACFSVAFASQDLGTQDCFSDNTFTTDPAEDHVICSGTPPCPGGTDDVSCTRTVTITFG